MAKGLIAKAFKKNPNKKKVFKVVYVCSNLALARQNLKKLNFSDDPRAIDYSDKDDRLTSLAYQPEKKSRQFPLSIKAFTPATSVDKNHAGKVDERLLIYRLLYGIKQI